MLNVGPLELLAIAVLALVVLGPDRLPHAVRQVGRVVGELRRISGGFQDELRRAMDDAIDEPDVPEVPSAAELPPVIPPEEAAGLDLPTERLENNGAKRSAEAADAGTTGDPPAGEPAPVDQAGTPGSDAPEGRKPARTAGTNGPADPEPASSERGGPHVAQAESVGEAPDAAARPTDAPPGDAADPPARDEDPSGEPPDDEPSAVTDRPEPKPETESPA